MDVAVASIMYIYVVHYKINAMSDKRRMATRIGSPGLPMSKTIIKVPDTRSKTILFFQTKNCYKYDDDQLTFLLKIFFFFFFVWKLRLWKDRKVMKVNESERGRFHDFKLLLDGSLHHTTLFLLTFVVIFS